MKPMTSLITAVMRTLRETPTQPCLVCGGRIGARDERVRIRGELHVHRQCATYSMRRRRTGSARLGYPRV